MGRRNYLVQWRSDAGRGHDPHFRRALTHVAVPSRQQSKAFGPGAGMESSPDASELPFKAASAWWCAATTRPRVFPSLLGDCVPALDAAEQAGCAVDVVAVNHGSSDHTGKVLDALTEEDERWHVVHLVRTLESKKEALAAGIAASEGDVLVLLDADCAPVDAFWLVNMTQGAGTAWDVGVGISLPQDSESMTFLAQVQRLEARRLAQRAVGAVDAGSRTSPLAEPGVHAGHVDTCRWIWRTSTCLRATTICGCRKP